MIRYWDYWCSGELYWGLYADRIDTRLYRCQNTMSEDVLVHQGKETTGDWQCRKRQSQDDKVERGYQRRQGG
jgi:hypothetical protein